MKVFFLKPKLALLLLAVAAAHSAQAQDTLKSYFTGSGQDSVERESDY